MRQPEWQAALSEIQFQNQVTALAEIYGWNWVHFRPGKTPGGWRTPSQGTMARGWPDLFMVRVRNGEKRTMVVELKREGGKPTVDQLRVFAILDAAGYDCRVWEPKDWPHIEAALK
jgi:nucleoside-diphosphate-sugar epimerase